MKGAKNRRGLNKGGERGEGTYRWGNGEERFLTCAKLNQTGIKVQRGRLNEALLLQDGAKDIGEIAV